MCFAALVRPDIHIVYVHPCIEVAIGRGLQDAQARALPVLWARVVLEMLPAQVVS